MAVSLDGVTALAPIRARIPDFAAFLSGAQEAEAFARLRAAETIGRWGCEGGRVARTEIAARSPG